MAQSMKNSTNYHGARSKTGVVENEGRSKKGRKNRHNSTSSDTSSSWDAKKTGGFQTEYRRSSRNGSMDGWDDIPNKSSHWDDGWTSNCRNKKQDPWPSDSYGGKKATVWDNIEQEFPSLDVQEAPRPNVWKDRQRKFDEVKSLAPTNEAEEERMMKLALELSKQDTQSLSNQKRLEEEYRLQEEILKQNPSEFKEFLIAEELIPATNIENSSLPESKNNSYSGVYASAAQNGYSSSNNNDWDTWNDYSDVGKEKNNSNKTSNLKNNAHWDYSTQKTPSKHKESTSIWGIDSDTNNWNGSSYKNNSSSEKSSNYKSSHWNDPPEKTKKSKQTIVSKSEDTEGIWGSDTSYVRSSNMDNISNSGAELNFTENVSTLNSASQLDEFPKPKKTSSKHKESGGTLGSKGNNRNSSNWDDNAEAREKRNYSNLDYISSTDQETYNKNKASNSKVPRRSPPVDISEDVTNNVKKVVNMFGGWASASDFVKKPSAKIETSVTTTDFAKNSAQRSKEIPAQNDTYEESVYPSKPTKLSMQEVSLKSNDASFQNAMTELGEKTGKLNLSVCTDSTLESQNYKLSGEINKGEYLLNQDFAVNENFISQNKLDFSKPKTYSEAPNKQLLSSTNECATKADLNSSDFLRSDVNKFANVPTNQNMAIDRQLSEFSAGVYEPIKTNFKSVTETNSYDETTDGLNALNSESRIQSPKPASDFLPIKTMETSESVESVVLSEKMKFPIFTSQSNNPNEFSPSSETFQNVQSNINSESNFNLHSMPSSTPHPVELPSIPVLPVNPMLSGFMNPMLAGVNPMMAGMTPLMMQQMIFFSNPFLAKQMQAMDMYYRSIGMPIGVQGMNPLQMHQTPGINVNSFSNEIHNFDNSFISAPVSSVKCDINAPVPPLNSDFNDLGINPPVFSQNSNLNCNDVMNLESHTLKFDPSSIETKELYDPADADSLLKEFLSVKEPRESGANFIPPPVEPDNYVNQSSSANYNPVANRNISSVARESALSGNGTHLNESIFPKESIDVPKSTGWGDKHNNAPADYKGTGWADMKKSDSADSKGTGWADMKRNDSADTKGTGWGDMNRNGSAAPKHTGWDDMNGNVSASPKSTGWGDIDKKNSAGYNSNWDDDMDGWGNENVTTKSMANPSEYESRKRGVNRQPSSHSTFSNRFKK